MEDDVKEEIDSINEKIDRYAGKRYNDVKTIAGIALTAISVVVIVFTIISGLTLKSEKEGLDRFTKTLKQDVDKNLSSTKDDLKEFTGNLRVDTNELLKLERDNVSDFKKEQKENYADVQKKVESALGKFITKPSIILLADMDKQLEGQTVNAKLSNNTLSYHFTIKNVGTAPTNPMYIKIYSRNPLVVGSQESSDEKDFQYEAVLPAEDIKTIRGIIPSQMSARLENIFFLKAPLEETKDSYPLLLKVYYGGDHPAEARFLIKISRE